MEIWKDIINYENLYQVSNLGNVRSYPRIGTQTLKIRVLKQATSKNGYKHITLCKNNVKENKLIHVLVAQAFIPNVNNKPCINHKDENPSNNNVNNLEWCDFAYNVNYGTRTIRAKTKLSKRVNQYDLQGNLIKTWDSISLAERTLCLGRNISEVCKGKKNTCGGYKWRYAD